jgi:hypothetical protein
VLVIEDGGVAEEGTPAELQRAGGRYAELMLRASADHVGAHEAEHATAPGPTVDQILARMRAEGHFSGGSRRAQERPPNGNGDVPGPVDGSGQDPLPAADVGRPS